MMKILGITGGIGAGKSTVLSFMKERYGARVIEADQVARDLQQPGGDCFDEIVSGFGTGILGADGRIDRGKLASVVFQDPERLALLNRIVHPAVRQRITDEIRRCKEEGSCPLVVIEAALLLEEHYDRICDEVWYIFADPRTRIQRLMDSRGYSREKAEQIMKNQLSDEQYRSRCSRVIDNSGDFSSRTRVQIENYAAILGISGQNAAV